MKFRNNFAVFTGFLIFLSACSHGPKIQELSDSASPSEEIQKLDADMRAALAQQANVLAPRSFEQAQSALDGAKKGHDKGRDSKDILHKISEGRAYLNRTNELAITSRSNMEDVVAARQQAIDAGATGFFGKELANTDDDLRSITSDVEKGDLSDVEQARPKLQAEYRALELKSIDHATLNAARDTINQAIKEGAKTYAAKTLGVAEKKVTDTAAYIVGNRRDTNEIQSRGAAARGAADHALKITRSSKIGKKTSSEDVALQMEGEQNKVQAKHNELADKQNQLEDKSAQLENKQIELTEERGSAEVLAVQARKLEPEKALDQRFETARAEFNESEAEVYRQGNKLTIRLKGLEFPVREAVLKSSNFALLAKVQKVLKDFGRSSISVEGHTDSNGGKLLNDKLSADRAEAVSQYLVANDSIGKVSVTSVGYGYQKPLATNKTASGRAQNRRVDIVITPDAMTSI